MQRTADMKKWMQLYGDFNSEADIDKTIMRMEIDPAKPMIALTFDDGPILGISDEIAHILSQYDCRATFFIRGARMKRPETTVLLKKLLAGGNEIGNHTWKHQILTSAPYPVLLQTIERVNEEVFAATGYTIRSLRPPGGYSGSNVARMAKKFDLAVILWAQSGNVHESDPAKIAENVQRQIVNGKELENGDIILLHDTKPWMVDAVAIMVPQLLQKGYQLVTVQELLHLSKLGFVAGETYYKQNETIIAK